MQQPLEISGRFGHHVYDIYFSPGCPIFYPDPDCFSSPASFLGQGFTRFEMTLLTNLEPGAQETAVRAEYNVARGMTFRRIESLKMIFCASGRL